MCLSYLEVLLGTPLMTSISKLINLFMSAYSAMSLCLLLDVVARQFCTESQIRFSYLATHFQVLMDGAYWWRSISCNQRAGLPC